MVDTRKGLVDFFKKFRLLTYKKGETILHAQDSPQGVFYLEEGFIRQFATAEAGDELTLIIFKPGDFFPLRWALGGVEGTYSIEAMTNVVVWRAPRQEFQEFVKSNPDILFHLTQRVLVRLGGLLSRMEYLTFGNAYEKVASIVAICAERFGKKEGRHIVVQVPLTHQDIAFLVGIARETTSVELKKLEKKGLIAFRNRLLVVHNLNRLHKESLLSSSPEE